MVTQSIKIPTDSQEEQVANANQDFPDLSPVDPGLKQIHAVNPYLALTNHPEGE